MTTIVPVPIVVPHATRSAPAGPHPWPVERGSFLCWLLRHQSPTQGSEPVVQVVWHRRLGDVLVLHGDMRCRRCGLALWEKTRAVRVSKDAASLDLALVDAGGWMVYKGVSVSALLWTVVNQEANGFAKDMTLDDAWALHAKGA